MVIDGHYYFGLNGSGKSTLGKELALQLKYKHMDIEDYFFVESKIPYTKQRSTDECYKLILEDIEKNKNFVLSVVNGDLGEEIPMHYKLGVFLETPYEIRIKRVKKRAVDRFGNRVRPGGDMYQSEQRFLEFAKSRDIKAIEEWSRKLDVPILRLDGKREIAENVKKIIEEYLKMDTRL